MISSKSVDSSEFDLKDVFLISFGLESMWEDIIIIVARIAVAITEKRMILAFKVKNVLNTLGGK